MPTRFVKIRYVVAIFFLLTVISARDVHALGLTPANGTAMAPQATQFLVYTNTNTLTATGGMTPPLFWSSPTGLPAGLTLTAAGTTAHITGTPTVSGTNLPFSVRVTDSRGTPRTVTRNYTITIRPYCRFSGTNTGTIAFGSAGSIDPSTSPGPITNTITGPLNFQCGAGLAYTVAVTNPAGQLQMTGANTIPFTLGLAPSATSASDAALISLLGPNAAPSIPASTIFNYQNFVAGSSSIGPITVRISWGGAAPGSMNATVNVTATTVTDICSAPVNGSITFNIDPSSAGPLTPNTTSNGASPTVMCTNGQSHGVSCTSSHGYQLTIGNDGMTDPIAYTITGCPASVAGSGFLTTRPINFGLSLSATGPNGYQNAAAGAHSDTITVQVSY